MKGVRSHDFSFRFGFVSALRWVEWKSVSFLNAHTHRTHSSHLIDQIIPSTLITPSSVVVHVVLYLARL